MSDAYGGKLRIFAQRHKAGKSTFSNSSLDSPSIPTLANPTRGFGITNNSPIKTATQVSTDFQEAQSVDQQSLEPETIQQKPLSHDISRMSLRRPQAKLVEQSLFKSEPDLIQKKATNITSFTAKSDFLQPKIGEGHDLTSPRFAGDPVLEACYDGEHRLLAPQTGPAVEKVQQALIDAGYPLPKFGADGKFGSETAEAVSKFKQDRSLSPSDGVVGPKTMAALDLLFSTGPVPPGPVPPGPVPPGPVPPGPTPPGPTPPGPTPPGPVPPGPVPPGPVPPGPVPPGPVPPGPVPPSPTPTGLSYEEAKKKIKDAADGWGTDEDGIYSAIRECSERNKLKNDPEVQAILKDEMSGHDLWKAQLLLEFGQESAFPDAIKEIWEATEGWGTDEDRIYKALQKLSEADVKTISNVPGLRDILNDELSGKDLNATNDLLSGDYAKQIAKHKENVTFIKQELADMKKPENPIRIRNTSEWLDPSTAGATAKNELYILTPTHDSLNRAKENGQDKQAAYFGDSPQFPDDSATYDAHIESERNIHYSAPNVVGEHLGKKIWLHDPKQRGSANVRGTLVHEVQHDADRHDSEEGHDKAFKSPEESWNRYKTEFRSYWIDGDFDSNSTVSGTATKTGFDNAKQEAIFLHMYGSDPKDVYAVWLRPNYDGNTKVGSNNFQGLVHGYTKPEGVNLINSPRIDDLFIRLEKCSSSDTDLKKTPLPELEAAANALNADDRTYVNSPEAKRLQDMMKKNLEKSVLTHIAKILNGGTEPAWAK